MLRYTEMLKNNNNNKIETVILTEYDRSHRLKQRCIGSGSSGSPALVNPVGSKRLPPAVTSVAPPSRKTATPLSAWALQPPLPLLSVFTTSWPGCSTTLTGRRRAKSSAMGKWSCWKRWTPLWHKRHHSSNPKQTHSLWSHPAKNT